MRIEDDEGLSNLIRSSEERTLCTGFVFTEGPLWLSAENCLLFSDIPGDRMHRWRPGMTAAEVYREPSRHANGLTLDREGRVLACEHSGRRVSRALYNGDPTPLVDRFQGNRFNSPNDIVIDSHNRVYFTDPTYGLLPQRRGRPVLGDAGAPQEILAQGVYRVDPNGALTCVEDDFQQPNGLAFSPDESLLYIGDSEQSIIKRFRVATDGALGDGEIVVDMRDDDRRGVPDGMKVDEAGRLWTTGAGGVWVVEPDGHRLGVFEFDEHAANLAFGGPDFSTLYLTTATSVRSIETTIRGIGPGSHA